MKYYINVKDFENNYMYVSPDGVTSDALKDGLEWDYIPSMVEVKRLYSKGWEYIRSILVLDNNGELIRVLEVKCK